MRSDFSASESFAGTYKIQYDTCYLVNCALIRRKDATLVELIDIRPVDALPFEVFADLGEKENFDEIAYEMRQMFYHWP